MGAKWYKFAWLTSGERIGLAVLLAVGLLLLLLSIRMGADSQLVVWLLLWLTGFALILRRFWVGLFGPVFSFDLVRTSRRSPIFSLRCLYAGALLVILYLLYISWFGSVSMPWEPAREVRLPIRAQAHFAYSFFSLFVAVQTAAVILITPLAVSSAIAEEKEKRTLSFLLATDLHDHEIVLGKLASRLTHLFLFLITGLPVLTLLQFMGGIDPNLVLATFFANAMTMFGLAGLSILCSVHAPKPLSAMVYSYLGTAGYVLTTCVCATPFTALFGTFGGSLDDVEQYAPLPLAVTSLMINGIVAFVCCKSAVANLRRRYRMNAPRNRELIVDEEMLDTLVRLKAPTTRPREEVLEERELAERRRPSEVPRSHPPIGRDPMLWKELYIDQGLGLPESLRALGQIPLIVGTVLLVYLLLVCGLQGMFDRGGSALGSHEFTNGIVRGLGTFIMCLMLCGVALRAAHCISSERDRRTLDTLLTAPMDNRAILRAKWWASFLYVRKGWWFLALPWFLGVFTLGLHVLAVPLLVFAWFMYAVFAAGLGLFFSLIAPTSLRATLGTLFLLMGAAFAPMAVWMIVEAGLRLSGYDHRYPWLLQFDTDLLVPPVALVKLAFAGQYDTEGIPLSGYSLAVMLAGTYAYGLFGAALWSITCARFGQLTGRMPYGATPAVGAQAPAEAQA